MSNDIGAELAAHRSSLRSIVRRIAKDAQIADDLTQECCIRILEKAPLYRERGGRLRQWMNTVTRNFAVTRLRREPTVADRALEATAPRWEERYEHIDWALREFERLPPAQKRILSLKYLDDLRNHEIAEQLGISKQTVSTHLQRGLTSLRKRARAEGLLAGLLPWADARGWAGATMTTTKAKTIALVATSLALGAAGGVVVASSPAEPAPAPAAATVAKAKASPPARDGDSLAHVARLRRQILSLRNHNRQLRRDRDDVVAQLEHVAQGSGADSGLADLVDRLRSPQVRASVAKQTVVAEDSTLEELLQAHQDLRQVADAYSPEMMETLRQIGEDHEDPDVRATVWRNFDGRSHLPLLAPALIDALQDQDWHPRREAVETLGNYADDPDALAAIERAAQSDPNAEVRRVAQRTLDGLGPPL